MTQKRPVVVGLGEILWDVFPEGKKLGGAPLNFSHHCAQLGAEAYPVSAVGADAEGMEIRQILAAKNLPDLHVQTDPAHPTGRVNVTLRDGKPTYEILRDVAWDNIQFTPTLADLATRADATCFGSLAQRNSASREAIHAFLDAMRPDSLRIFDINLRQDFYNHEIIESSLRRANILKLSDEELPVLAAMFELPGHAPAQLHRLRELFDLRLVAYTRGGSGSLLLTATESSDHLGLPTDVLDTVGAGDSFTATLCTGLLQNLPLAEINTRANRVAAFVCSQAGATPTLPRHITNS
jgi:fructokinase